MVKRLGLIAVLFVLLVACAFIVNANVTSDVLEDSGQTPVPSNSSAATHLPTQEPTIISEPQQSTQSSVGFGAVAIGVSAAVLSVGLIFYVFRRNNKG